MNQTTEIQQRLKTIQLHYDIDDLLRHKTDKDAVAKYYRHSDFFYNLIHSGGGHNIHMALSDDGVFHKKDFQEQAKFVAKFITNSTSKVLEVGAGKVANTKYLARQFPAIQFTALDIPNRNFLKTTVPKNVSLIEGDYNDLSGFPMNSFDVAFAVETICHSKSKEKVLRQLSRVIKPGGTLIIFDVYEPLSHNKMTDFQKQVSAITLAAMRVTPNDLFIGNTERYLNKTGFTNIRITDLTSKIRPNLRRLERISRKYFEHPILAQMLRRVIAEDATINSVAGYLMLLTFDGNTIHQYNRIVAKKSEK